MLVFNLSNCPIYFYKKVLQAQGGSCDIPQLDEVVPKSVQKLVTNKLIALKELPDWWKQEHKKSTTPPSRVVIPIPVEPDPKEPEKQSGKSSKKK
jgi:hypothetical protein